MYVRLATVRLMNGVLYYLQIPNGSLVLHTRNPIRLTVGMVAFGIIYLFCIIARYKTEDRYLPPAYLNENVTKPKLLDPIT